METYEHIQKVNERNRLANSSRTDIRRHEPVDEEVGEWLQRTFSGNFQCEPAHRFFRLLSLLLPTNLCLFGPSFTQCRSL